MNDRVRREGWQALAEKTTPRIRMLASFVRRGEPAWDFGCDHGLIGLWAYYGEGASEVLFIDESRAVTERLSQTLARFAAADAPLRVVRKRAQELPLPSEPVSCIMAGMGHQTILAICEAGGWFAAHRHRLILSPHSRPNDVV